MEGQSLHSSFDIARRYAEREARRVRYGERGLTRHSIRSYEMRANENAKNYFSQNYGVTWDEYNYPIVNPFE